MEIAEIVRVLRQLATSRQAEALAAQQRVWKRIEAGLGGGSGGEANVGEGAGRRVSDRRPGVPGVGDSGRPGGQDFGGDSLHSSSARVLPTGGGQG